MPSSTRAWLGTLNAWLVFLVAIAAVATSGCSDETDTDRPRRPTPPKAPTRRVTEGITVRVSGRDGQPLADVVVEARLVSASKGKGRWPFARSGLDGRAVFHELAIGQYEFVAVSAPTPYVTTRLLPEASHDVLVRGDVDSAQSLELALSLDAAAALRVLPVGDGAEQELASGSPDGLVAIKHRSQDEIWRPLPRVPARREAPSRAGDPGAFLIAGIPAGDYLVGLNLPDRIRRFVPVSVAAGETRDVRLELGPRGMSLALSWSGPPLGSGDKVSFNVNAADRPLGGPVGWGAFTPGDLHATIGGLEAGKYLVLLWQRGECMLVEKDGSAEQHVMISPPARPAQGDRSGKTVRISTRRGGIDVTRCFVALAPGHRSQMEPGKWMRFARTPAEFVGVSRGAWTIVWVDGVFGVTAGSEPPVRMKTVDIDTEDIDLALDI